MTDEAWTLSLAEGLRALRAGRMTAEAWTESLIGRIAACEPIVNAWSFVDADGALRAARAVDRDPATARTNPLMGAPVGVKDIIDVAGLPCEGGSRLYAGGVADADADCVAALRETGAIVLGKTTTCELATNAISPVRNPHAPDRTPGGSSAGSAAAVAAGMAPAAIGTQTGGSVLRPAAYCGVVGFKPSFGAIPCAGAMPLSWSFDHVGMFARSPDDLPPLFAALTRRAPGAPKPAMPRRVGFLADDFLPRASAAVIAAVEDAADRLAAKGADVRRVRLPLGLDAVHAAARTIIRSESAAVYADAFADAAALFGPDIGNNVRTGRTVPAVLYLRAQRFRTGFRRRLDAMMGEFDILLTPATLDTAPQWDVSTGDPLFSEPFSASGHPAMTLPAARDPGGLPIGVQIVGRRGGDTGLMAAAMWCGRELGWTGAIARPGGPPSGRRVPVAAEIDPAVGAAEMAAILETVANLSVNPSDQPSISCPRDDDDAN